VLLERAGGNSSADCESAHPPTSAVLALPESVPKPSKQQRAAQGHEEWSRINHRPPPMQTLWAGFVPRAMPCGSVSKQRDR
jgi:hypothetical protein